jgi:hypothetical protein
MALAGHHHPASAVDVDRIALADAAEGERQLHA